MYGIWRLFCLFLPRGAGVCRPQAAWGYYGRHSSVTLPLTFLKLSRKQQLQSSNLEQHYSQRRNI